MAIKRCVHPDCITIAYTRGLCKLHYNKAAYRVNNKKTTWAALVALGLATEQDKDAQRDWVFGGKGIRIRLDKEIKAKGLSGSHG